MQRIQQQALPLMQLCTTQVILNNTSAKNPMNLSQEMLRLRLSYKEEGLPSGLHIDDLIH